MRGRRWLAAACLPVVLGAGVTAPAAAAGGSPSDLPVSTWQANGRVSAIAVAGGIAYIGGSFTSLSSHGSRTTIVRNHLAAIDEATGKPTAWNPNANGPVHVLRVVGGRMVVGGRFSTIAGTRVANLAAVSLSNGRIVPTFRARVNGEVDALAALPGRLYLGGTFKGVDGSARQNLAAVTLQTGALDPLWRSRTDGSVHALLAVPGSGRILIGGKFAHVDGAARPDLASVGPKLGGVRRWATAPLGEVWSLATPGSGSPLYAAVGGHEGGQLDSFQPSTGILRWQRFADGDVQAVTVAGGSILAGGHFINACATTQGGGSPWVCTVPVMRERFFATTSTGALLPWNPGANSLYGVWALRADAGHVVAGGDFTDVDGAHQARYAEFVRS